MTRGVGARANQENGLVRSLPSEVAISVSQCLYTPRHLTTGTFNSVDSFRDSHRMTASALIARPVSRSFGKHGCGKLRPKPLQVFQPICVRFQLPQHRQLRWTIRIDCFWTTRSVSCHSLMRASIWQPITPVLPINLPNCHRRVIVIFF